MEQLCSRLLRKSLRCEVGGRVRRGEIANPFVGAQLPCEGRSVARVNERIAREASPGDNGPAGEGSPSGTAWTHTMPDGTHVSSDTGQTCSDWTDSSGVPFSFVGDVTASDQNWTLYNVNVNACDGSTSGPSRLYCSS